MDVYKDSILEEFREYSLLEYNVLRMAKMEFPEENKLILTLEDSVIARQRTEEIVRILEKMLLAILRAACYDKKDLKQKERVV